MVARSREFERNPLKEKNEYARRVWRMVPYGKDLTRYGLNYWKLDDIAEERGYWKIVDDHQYWLRCEVLPYFRLLVTVLRKRQLESPRKLYHYYDLFELISMMIEDHEGEKTAELFSGLERAGIIAINGNRQVLVKV